MGALVDHLALEVPQEFCHFDNTTHTTVIYQITKPFTKSRPSYRLFCPFPAFTDTLVTLNIVKRGDVEITFGIDIKSSYIQTHSRWDNDTSFIHEKSFLDG